MFSLSLSTSALLLSNALTNCFVKFYTLMGGLLSILFCRWQWQQRRLRCVVGWMLFIRRLHKLGVRLHCSLENRSTHTTRIQTNKRVMVNWERATLAKGITRCINRALSLYLFVCSLQPLGVTSLPAAATSAVVLRWNQTWNPIWKLQLHLERIAKRFVRCSIQEVTRAPFYTSRRGIQNFVFSVYV